MRTEVTGNSRRLPASHSFRGVIMPKRQVRVFTNAGYVDYPFIVSVIDPPDENPDA